MPCFLKVSCLLRDISHVTTAIFYSEISLIYLLFKKNSLAKSIFMPPFHVPGTTGCSEYSREQDRI